MTDRRAKEMYNLGMGIAQMAHGMKERQKKEAHQRKVNDYTLAIESGKSPEEMPEFRGDFDGEAASKAYAMHHQKQMNNESVRAARLENQMAEAKVANFELGEKLQQIDALGENLSG